jgi:hypothetical protein
LVLHIIFFEIKLKILQNVTVMGSAPRFRNNKNYFGRNRFKRRKKLTRRKFIALGGISNNNIKTLNLLNGQGFAGISLFKKKGPFKKRGLNIM